MATGVEETAGLAAAETALLNVAANLASVAQGIQAVSSMMLAQEGLKYNNYSFEVEVQELEIEVDNHTRLPKKVLASTQTRGHDKEKVSTLGKIEPKSPPIPKVSEAFANVLMITVKGGTVIGGDARVTFSLDRYFVDKVVVGGRIQVTSSEGFESSIGNQVEVDFSGFKVSDGHMLTFTGFLNPTGFGFCRFGGSTLIKPDGKVLPVSMSVNQEAHGEFSVTKGLNFFILSWPTSKRK